MYEASEMNYFQKRTGEFVSPIEDNISTVEELLSSIELAESQVATTADKTIKDINVAFDSLSAALVNAVEQRKQALTVEVQKAQQEGIASLQPFREQINSDSRVNKPIVEDHKGEKGPRRKVSFAEGISRFPRKEEVPHISAQLSLRGLQARLCSEIMAAGKVSNRGPVQLTDVEEKPGALLLHWEEVEPERPVDVSQFRLQRAHGDVCAEPQLEANFHDVYRGPEGAFLSKELIPGQAYTFRVCCRAEGDQEWSAWSLPRVATTNQQPFCWDHNNSNYQVTNENKIATKVTPEGSILFSNGAQFGPGHSIEFTVLEAKEGLSDEGFGLTVRRLQGDSLLQPGALFLSAQGCVFVDGSAKTTRLPPLTQGCKVSFTCERIRDDRLRINIDNDNKTVTYDWRVGDQPLLFALSFNQIGWKVLVE